MSDSNGALQVWHFRDGQIDAATELVKRFHYSRRMPSSIQFVASAHAVGGLFGDFGEPVAAVVFGEPAARWSEPVLELSRLVRRDDVAMPLSSLISWGVRWLDKSRVGVDLLVSFADATQGHHGGIYQACSWNYHGQRSRRMDGMMINGAYVAGRVCNHRWGTQSPDLLRAKFPAWDIVPHFDDGKHLYWKPLGRSGNRKAARLGLTAAPYPKPDLQHEVAA